VFLEPDGNGGKVTELLRIETSAGLMRLTKIEYPKGSGQQVIYVVQGRTFYFYILTNKESDAKKKFYCFQDLVEIAKNRQGYEKMRNFIKSYVRTSMGCYDERK
jgi:hypothetical protein